MWGGGSEERDNVPRTTALLQCRAKSGRKVGQRVSDAISNSSNLALGTQASCKGEKAKVQFGLCSENEYTNCSAPSFAS